MPVKKTSKFFVSEIRVINVHEACYTCMSPGERPFRCQICNKAFNQKGALQIHMTGHTGEKPHSCDFCPASFSQKGNLRAHIQVA